MFSTAIITWIVIALSVGVVTDEESVVWNVSVAIVALGDESSGIGKTIKLNVSWLPPENEDRLLSYSVAVTRVRVNLTNSTGNVFYGNGDDVKDLSSFYPEGSVYYADQDANHTNILLPVERFESADRLDIQLGCTYAIQVIANPWIDDAGVDTPSTSIRSERISLSKTADSTARLQTMFTVPECVGGRCSCDAMLDALPIPVVTVINPYNGGTLINWKIKSTKLTTDHKQFNIKSFAISAGIPYITSSSDEVLYNKTLIFSGKADNNSFYWKQEKLKKGTKIFVTAQDSYGCSGREGTYTIKRLRHHSFYRKNIATVIFAGLVVLCLMLSGLFNFIQYCLENHKYKLCSWRKKSTRKLSSIFHKPKIEILLRNENTLYIDKKIEVLS